TLPYTLGVRLANNSDRHFAEFLSREFASAFQSEDLCSEPALDSCCVGLSFEVPALLSMHPWVKSAQGNRAESKNQSKLHTQNRRESREGIVKLFVKFRS